MRPLDKRWHRAAQFYKETVFNLDQVSEIDKQRYDLEEQHRRPRGRENPHTWLFEKPLLRVNKPSEGDRLLDARTSPLIRDGDPDVFDEVIGLA